MAEEKYSLTSSLDENGIWWLPDNPERKVAGRITLRNDSLRLILQGSLEDSDEAFRSLAATEFKEFELVLGILRSGRPCTIVRALRGNVSLSAALSVSFESELLPEYLFIGIHFNGADEVKFKKLSVRFSNLEDWLQNTGVTKEYTPAKLSKDIRMSWSYHQPEPQEFKIPNGQLQFGTTWTTNFQPAYEISLVEWANATFIFPEPTDILDGLRSCVSPFRNFLSLAIGKPIRILSLTAMIESTDSSQSSDEGQDKDTWVDVVYALHQIPRDKERGMLSPFMLLPYPSIRDSFQQYILKWYEVSDQLDDIVENFWGVIHSDSLSVHHEFQSLTGVLEAYHARVIDDSDVYLLDRLRYLCTPIFKLLDVEDAAADPILERIRDTRHYYAHYSEKRRESRLEPRSLWVVNQFLKWAFRYALLTQVGMTETESAERIGSSQDFLQFRSLQWRQFEL